LTLGFIDSASTYGVVEALGHSRPRDAYPWCWRAALEVSMALVSPATQNLLLAPSPGTNTGTVSGPYGQLMSGLSSAIGNYRIADDIRLGALKKTKSWARTRPGTIQKAFATLRTDPSFAPWLGFSIREAWVEHSRRLGGLFNRELIGLIAKVLDLEEPAVLVAWEKSCDLSRLEEDASRILESPEYCVMRDAYVVAGLIRGRFHEHVAKDSGSQIIQHPFRSVIALPTYRLPCAQVEFSNSASYLANIILAGSLSESGYGRRIEAWLHNVLLSRNAISQGEVDLPHKPTHESALSHAIGVAKKVGLRTHARLLDDVVDAAVGAGIGYLTSFVLVGWTAFGVGAAVGLSSRRKRIGEQLNALAFERTSRLVGLALSGPGRVQPIWLGTGHNAQ